MSIEELCEVLSDYAQGQEALAVKLKHDIATLAGKKLEPEADFNKLFWEKKTGTKGEFEQTSDKANQNCVLWQQLKAKLKENKGFWQHGGFKLWFDMQNETVVDRRKIA